ELIAKILYDINEKLSFHDFRVVSGPTHTNVIFDIVVPQDFLLSDRLLIKEVKERMLEIDKKISLVINIDHNYLI
ncbi:MAG: cation-efflux pump, partial [Bacilli bacterium]|nr:cation-efflux pump [Bacilli bacterium]